MMSDYLPLTIQSMLVSAKADLALGKTFVGIDFGTSTTVVSIASYDPTSKSINVTPIRLSQLLIDENICSSEKVPSVIAWFRDRIFVGEGASRLKYDPEMIRGKNIWYSFKMEIGEDLGVKYCRSELMDPTDNRIPAIRNPKDCVRLFFMYLKMMIDRYCRDHNLSDNINYAISIPASFEANQRRDLLEALGDNDMVVSRQSLIDEPNAAFLSYVRESQQSDNPLIINPGYNPKVLVFDFGGGTCDISILEIGLGANGFYSKNLSISKFTKLGGDDIDRYLAYNYLLPRFLEANNCSEKEFRTNQIKRITTQLYHVAEKLKIQICEDIAIMTENFSIPSIRESEEKTTLDVEVTVNIGKKRLYQRGFYLTPKELSDAMSVFTQDNNQPTKLAGQDDYDSILTPINSAIRKAGIDLDELDYILLIGGSSKNPFVQEALSKHFADSELLVPRDLQTHVSGGAAIHSLLLNGLNKCIIRPITSEPILVITKDQTDKILIPAGTEIPCEPFVYDDLVPGSEGQDTIELPICVGNHNKILFNLKISNNGHKYPANAPIKLALELTADKLLVAEASCMGNKCSVEPSNPFANKELTTSERIVVKAERQANIEAAKNDGIPTKRSLIDLREAYERAGNDFMAAETYEQQIEFYPDDSCYNSIGVLYSNAGRKDRAIEYYERALSINPQDFYPRSNLGHNLMYSDRERAEELLRGCYRDNPNHCPTMISLARIESEKGNTERASELYNDAYGRLYKRWKADMLDDYEYSWLSSVARTLGKYDIARQVQQSLPGVTEESYYNEENLAKTKLTGIEKY